MRTIKFDGTEIANIDELFGAAKGMWSGGWHDCPIDGNNQESWSCRNVLCFLPEEDAVRRYLNYYSFEEGDVKTWMKYHGPVMLSEHVNGCSETEPFKHRYIINPIKEPTSGGHQSIFEYDEVDEPDGRTAFYQEKLNWTRDPFTGNTVYYEA